MIMEEIVGYILLAIGVTAVALIAHYIIQHTPKKNE